jgi:hypothetical protein
MIESCALFFGLLWLALLADFLSRARLPILLLTVLAGTAAILAKATTFPAFLLLGGLLFLHYARRDGLSLPNRRMLLLAVLAFAIPLLLGYAWVVYSDAVKQHNPFGALLTSGNLAFWSFGDWSQRASRELWLGTILLRTLRNAFGYGFPLAIVLTSIALVSRRWTLPAIAAVLAYLVPFLIFTNLHLQHDYYQNANALFALAAVAFGVAGIAMAGYRRTAALLLLVLAALQLAFFWREEAPYLTADLTRSPQLSIALMARQRTPPESGLVIIGDDWSSTIPYYAERKAVSIPGWTPRPVLERLLADPVAFLGGQPLGGIVYCPLSAAPSEIAPLLQAFVAGRRLLGKAYGCRLLAAH